MPHNLPVIERTIATGMHGRYLVRPPAGTGRAPLLVGFHGYGELAEDMLARLTAIEGAEEWLLVSIQGLNRFYQRRTNEVIAGWMTRQDRLLAIADNIEYVGAVVAAVAGEWHAPPPTILAGFSQGVAMAFRAAAALGRPVAGVIAAGGDVPPELDGTALRRVTAAVVCRGLRDEWYSSATHAADLDRLRAAGVRTIPVEFEGGHEWSAAVLGAAAHFLHGAR